MELLYYLLNIEDMEDTEITEISRDANSFSLLIIKEDGNIMRIVCPFPVRCLTDVNVYMKGALLMVQFVKISHDSKLLYIISNSSYSYKYFMIVLNPIWNQIN